MINDDIFPVRAAKSIITPISIDHSSFLVFITHPETEKADNDIITAQPDRIIGETDPITGGRLTCNSYISFDG